MISVTQLKKAFGGVQAVDGVDWQIPAGGTFGLLGPNGAGKTTVIRMMTGLLQPDSGEVRIGGADPCDPEVRRQIGLAPQAVALYDELPAQENLQFFGKLYGFSGATLRERVDWCLEFAGLTDRRQGRVHTFSGGMKRRLNIACALVHDPRVILLDEPTVGVDPQSRNHIFDSIEKLSAEQRTIIYTTHYMEEAQRLCDRVAIMDHGKVLDLDTVDGLIDRHGGNSVVTAQLLRPPDDPDRLGSTFDGLSLDGLSLRIESQNPMEDLARLNQAGVAVTTLRVDRPDLETVFLTLTGRSLRDT